MRLGSDSRSTGRGTGTTPAGQHSKLVHAHHTHTAHIHVPTVLSCTTDSFPHCDVWFWCLTHHNQRITVLTHRHLRTSYAHFWWRKRVLTENKLHTHLTKTTTKQLTDWCCFSLYESGYSIQTKRVRINITPPREWVRTLTNIDDEYTAVTVCVCICSLLALLVCVCLWLWRRESSFVTVTDIGMQ